MSGSSKSSTDQHYVPQLLLRGFATVKRKQVYAFDKQTERVFRSSVRNLACERGFYDLGDGEDKSGHDQWLGQLEEQAGPVMQSIRNRRTLDHLELGERQWVAGFIAVQHVRTLRHRLVWGDVNKQMADALREMGAEPNKVKNFRELTEEEVRENAIEDMAPLALGLVPHLLDKAWILFSTPPGMSFWIGDHPVVLVNDTNPGDGIQSTIGFGVRGIEIYLPVSSALTLGCLCPTIRAMFAAGRELSIPRPPGLRRAEDFLEAFTGRTTLQLEAENVTYHNSMQVAAAERFVFSLHDDFSMAREMLGSHPHLKSGPRIELVGRPRQKGA